MESGQKLKDNHQIPTDILDDLASRFIINVPVQERSDFIRICFQIELAHWFYLDFYCAEDEKLVPCGIKQFASHIFNHIPFLSPHLARLTDIMNEFKVYKMSVPTHGAILIADDSAHVLLVQSYWAKSSWGFPKGKVNEDEEPLHCAIREVYEETGYDISKLIQPNDYIDCVINYQYTRLYIVKNVPMETVFIPRTRKEIKCCEWYKLDHLPTHKSDTVSKSNLGINPNSFFMIMPFVKRLKKWLTDERQKDEVFLMNNSVSSQPQLKAHKKTNNLYGCSSSASSSGNINKKRQRHKSMGDLDGTAVSVANVLTNTPKNTLTTSSNSSNNKKDKPKANTKRQLFSVGLNENNGSVVQINNNQTATNFTQTPISNNKLLNKQQSSSSIIKIKKKTFVSVIDSINNDPNIKKWKNFTFNIDSIINVL